MQKLGVAAAFAAALCWWPQCNAAQAPQAAFRASTGEVLVDVVIRDKKGKLVRDLKAADLTVLENGLPQPIVSFREVRANAPEKGTLETTTQTAGAASQGIQLQRQIRLVSLVFEGMDQNSRRNARQAALDFLAADLGPNVYYAVFQVDRTFRPVLSYSNDHDRIKRAIEQVAATNKGGPVQINTGAGPAPQPAAPGQSGRGPDFAGAIARMGEFNSHMDMNLTGAVKIFSLWGVLNELGRLPGRKSVLYFSQGFTLPIDYRQHYLGMISAANRANVSIYTIDARGLVTGSDMMAARPGAVFNSGSGGGDVTTRPAEGTSTASTMGMDAAQQSIYANQQQNLFDISERTGGFLIANTNDFHKPMLKLSDDFNTYYEVTYKQPDTNYDGRFRAITVKASRDDYKIQSRDGYFALPPMEGQAVFPFEVPLLHALGKAPLPHGLEYRARVLQFRERASLVFDLPLDQVTFMKDEKGIKAKSYVSFLALIKDEKGQVVSKMSRDLPLEHPFEKVPEFRQGRSIYTRAVALAPGRYTLESAVSDNLAGKAAAKRSVLIVAAGNGGALLSDVALVRRVEPVGEAAEAGDPLMTAGGRVVPTLQDSFRAGRGGQLAALLVVYPEAGGVATEVYLDLLADGKLVRRETPKLPSADGQGAITLIARMPIEALPAGQYELRAGMLQGSKGAKRSIAVTIE